MSVREQVVLMGVEAGTAILGASGGPQHVNPPPVLPRTKIGKLDCLFLVPIMASISLVILLVQAFGPRIYRFINKRLAARRGYDTVIPEEDETETAPAPKTYMPSEGLGKDLMKHIKLVGIVAWVFDLLRLLVIMTLFALSIYATVVAHAPVAHGHPGKQGAHGLGEDGEMTALRGKGRHGNGNGKKHRKNRKANFDFVTQEWAEFGLTVFFAYTLILCALLLGLKVTSPLRKPIALHSYALLFLTWCIFAYRDLYPLLTKTLTPVDILHAPAWLTWTRIALLTIAAAVLPSLQPQRYLNLTWASLDLGKFGIGSNKAQSFLKDYVPSSESRVEPHITLTFAQSLDDKIAGAGGKQLALSGKESMLMTHWMRSMHEGIMVGVGTAINDDPRLNVRLLSQSYHSQTPQPIVLDPKLRLPPTARMLQALKDKDSPHAKTPWLLCQKIQDWDQDIKQRKALLEEAGAKIVEVDMVEGRMDLATLPLVLKQLEIRTLMIEGGSSIIDQVLKATRSNPDGLKRPLADSIIVTIAPVNVGADGTGYSIGSGFEAISSAYQRKSSQKFGKDNVLAFTNSFALSA